MIGEVLLPMMLIGNLSSYKAYNKVAHITLVARLRDHPFSLRVNRCTGLVSL